MALKLKAVCCINSVVIRVLGKFSHALASLETSILLNCLDGVRGFSLDAPDCIVDNVLWVVAGSLSGDAVGLAE